MFLSYLQQNPTDSDKMWYIFSSINLSHRNVNVFHLTKIVSTLPCETWHLRFASERQNQKMQQNVCVISFTKRSWFWQSCYLFSVLNLP